MILRLLKKKKVTKYPAVLSNEPKRDYTELFTVDKKYISKNTSQSDL